MQGGHDRAGQGDTACLLQDGDRHSPGVAVPAWRDALLDHGGRRRGDPRLPELDGRYIWSDLCDGRIYALDPAGPPGEESLGISVDEPTSFGTDATNRIYVASAAGPVYRIDPR